MVATDEPSSDAVLVGFFPAGLNPAVIQLVWRSRAVEMTAHALEGLIPQRTALRALGGMEQVLAPYATSG